MNTLDNRIKLMNFIIQDEQLSVLGGLSDEDKKITLETIKEVFSTPGWLPLEPDKSLIYNMMVRLDHSIGAPSFEIPNANLYGFFVTEGQKEDVEKKASWAYSVIFEDALSGFAALNERETEIESQNLKVKRDAMRYAYTHAFLVSHWRMLERNGMGHLGVSEETMEKLTNVLGPHDARRMLEEVSEAGFYVPRA